MRSIPNIIGVLSCAFLRCLGLSTVASSADQFNADHMGGKILTVDDRDRFVRGKEVKGTIVKIGGEVRMPVDANTHKRSTMTPKVGKHVLENLDGKGHAVSFLIDATISH